MGKEIEGQYTINALAKRVAVAEAEVERLKRIEVLMQKYINKRDSVYADDTLEPEEMNLCMEVFVEQVFDPELRKALEDE